GLVKGGTLSVATSAAQEARLRHRLEQERAWGDDAGTVRYLEKTELDDHPGRGPALRVNPGDVDLGRAGSHPGRRRARALYRALHRRVHRGHAGPAPDAAADEQLDDHHRPARR